MAAVEQVPSAWLPVAECFITQIATRLSLGEGSGGKERDEASRGGSRSLVAPSLKKVAKSICDSYCMSHQFQLQRA